MHVAFLKPGWPAETLCGRRSYSVCCTPQFSKFNSSGSRNEIYGRTHLCRCMGWNTTLPKRLLHSILANAYKRQFGFSMGRCELSVDKNVEMRKKFHRIRARVTFVCGGVYAYAYLPVCMCAYAWVYASALIYVCSENFKLQASIANAMKFLAHLLRKS